MTEPIEGLYFDWLCAKVVDRNPQVPNYQDLMRILYSTEFVWVVPGDKNRMEDGVELRLDFLTEVPVEKDPFWYERPCSVLEMLLAFARKAEFQTEIPYREWFWRFLTNLGLNEYRTVSHNQALIIEEILYHFVWRTYRADGYGGMFPMSNTTKDQTKVEIWYQFCEYVIELGLV